MSFQPRDNNRYRLRSGWTRVRALAVGLVVVLLAGCLSPPRAAAPPEAAAALPAGGAPFAALLCAGDVVVPLDGARDADCNTQVTVENGPAAEVHFAVNPLDPLNLVGGGKDFTLGEDVDCGKYNVWSGVYWSRDGGRTWGNGLLPGHPKDARKTALSDFACGSDPVLAFGPDGTAYYASIHVTESEEKGVLPPQTAPVTGYPILNSGLAVTRSQDGGETWDDPVVLLSVDDGSIIDKEWIAVDPRDGTLYVTYILNGVLSAFRSDDAGATWTDPVPIAGDDGNPVQFGQVAVTGDGVVHFVYWGVQQAAGETSGIYHTQSGDRGATWSAPVRAAAFAPVIDPGTAHKYRIVTLPALAVDNATGALYVAYPMAAEPGAAPRAQADLDILAVASKDGGATWSAPVRVNDDLVGPQNGQWMPAVAVGPEGTLHVTWLDYRDDPTGQNALTYYAHSKDGGATFSTNVRLGDVPFDGTGGYHQSGAGTIGDYMGLVASPFAVHAFWADTRDGRNDVFTATVLAR